MRQSTVVYGLVQACACSVILSAAIAQVRNDSISGRVIDQSGEGLSGVMVGIYANSPVQWVKTKQDGTFSFNRVKPGIYYVTADAQGLLSSGEQRKARTGDVLTLTLVPGGVITGRVTDQNGDPVVEISAMANLTRSVDGTVPQFLGYGPRSISDDRGIYRFYGLAPGRYIVGVNSGYSFPTGDIEFSGDVPTYHPSSDRASATEVEVAAGQEVTGVDIRYRSVSGRSISGLIEGLPSAESVPGSTFQVVALQLPERIALIPSRPVRRDERSEFSMSGVPDGDYELVAQFYSKDESYTSDPFRVSIRGNDVRGIRLKAQRLASISGSIVIEKSSEKGQACPNLRPSLPEEVMIRAALERGLPEAQVNSSREFRFANLKPERIRLFADLPGEHWYVRSIATPKMNDINRRGIDLKYGDRVADIVVTIAQDGAQITGKAGGKGQKRVFLIPAGAEQTDDIHRYNKGLTGSDGSFSMSNVAPGEYFFYSSDYIDSAEHPLMNFQSDEKSRARLRELASQFGTKVTLASCQRMKM